MFYHLVHVLTHLCLTGHCFSDVVCSLRVNFFSQIHQQVEVTILEAALLHVSISPHVFLQVLRLRITPSRHWELSLLHYRKLVALRCSMGDLHQQKLRLELSGTLACH